MRCLQAALSVTDEVNVSLIHFFADSVNREGHRGKGENGGRLVHKALFFLVTFILCKQLGPKNED